MTQRLPEVNGDDGTWGTLLIQWLTKEHEDVNPGSLHADSGRHKTVTIKAGEAGVGKAPLKFIEGTVLGTPEAGALEFINAETGLTFTAVGTRRQVVLDTATQTLTNKSLTSPVITTGVSGTAVDTDGGLVANSATIIPAQSAVKTYADTKAPNIRAINTAAPLSGGGDLSADRTLTTSMTTNRLIGRSTAATGVMEEITLGTNLSFTGTTLNAAGGGGTPGGSDTQVQFNDAGAFGGDAGFTYNKTTDALTVVGAITGSNLSGTNTGDVANTALTTNPLSQFASTTSLQLLGVISDETGTDALVFANTPTLVTPAIGTATGTGLDITGIIRNTAYSRVGSLAAPTYNTADGDITVGRLNIGDLAAFGTITKMDVRGTNTSTASGAQAFTHFLNTIAPTSSSSSEFRALNFQNKLDGGAGITYNNVTGGYFEGTRIGGSATGTLTNLYALRAHGLVMDGGSATASVTNVWGLYATGHIQPVSSAATISTKIIGIEAVAIHGGAVTATTATGILIANNGSGSTLTTTYGLDVASQTRGTTNIGIRNASTLRQTAASTFGADAAPATSAIVDIQSTTGALLLPRMNTTQQNALTAVNGMILYNSTTGKIQGYEAGAWVDI